MVEKNPYNINVVKQLFIYGVSGLIFVCGVLFVIYYFDNTIKGKKEIENKLHLAVLGEIPAADRLVANNKGFKKIFNDKDHFLNVSKFFDKKGASFEEQKEGGK